MTDARYGYQAPCEIDASSMGFALADFEEVQAARESVQTLAIGGLVAKQGAMLRVGIALAQLQDQRASQKRCDLRLADRGVLEPAPETVDRTTARCTTRHLPKWPGPPAATAQAAENGARTASLPSVRRG